MPNYYQGAQSETFELRVLFNTIPVDQKLVEPNRNLVRNVITMVTSVNVFQLNITKYVLLSGAGNLPYIPVALVGR